MPFYKITRDSDGKTWDDEFGRSARDSLRTIMCEMGTTVRCRKRKNFAGEILFYTVNDDCMRVKEISK